MNAFQKWKLCILTLLLQLPFLLWLAEQRFIAGDEGFYIQASKDLARGAIPYLDFFYPQAPLLPFVYGFWIKLFGASWFSARVLSCLFSAAIGSLLFLHLYRRFALRWCIFALILFNASCFVFPWYVTVKTYTLSVFCVFMAFYLLEVKGQPERRELFLSGLFLGLAVETRLFFAALVPVFVMYVYFLTRKRGLQPVSMFLLGGIFAALPMIIFCCISFESFWFNNMGYHLMRSSKDVEASLKNKQTIFLTIFGLRDTLKFHGLQFPLLLYISFLGILVRLLRDSKISLAALILLALFAVNFLPTPSYVQYFVTLAPFAIIVLIETLKIDLRSTFLRKVLVIAFVCFGVEYFRVFLPDVYKYTRNGIGVLGVRSPEKAPDRKLAAMRSIAQMIDSQTLAGEKILCFWPGYLIDSHASAWPGLENHFSIKVADKVSPTERELFKILTKSEALDLIRNKQARYLLLSPGQEKSRVKTLLKSYQQIGKRHGVSFWKLKA